MKEPIVCFRDLLDIYPSRYSAMFETLRQNIKDLLSEKGKGSTEKLQQICDLLQSELSHYDWVGFYFRNGAKEELKLGP